LPTCFGTIFVLAVALPPQEDFHRSRCWFLGGLAVIQRVLVRKMNRGQAKNLREAEARLLILWANFPVLIVPIQIRQFFLRSNISRIGS